MTQRLALALLGSLLLHLGLLGAPAWHLATPGESLSAESPSLLEAHMTPASVSKNARPSPSPPKRKTRRSAPATRAAVDQTPPIEPPPALPSNSAMALPSSSAKAPPDAEIAPSAIVPAVPAELATPAISPPDLAVAASEPALPRQGQIRFAISRGDQGFIIGQSLHRWHHDGKRYTLSSVTETTGIAALFKPARVMQASEGEIGATGLRPSEFRTEKNAVAGDAASFDWTAMTLKLSAGSQREVPLVNGAQDMLSMFYQISALIPWRPHALDEIMVATGRKFERYSFEVIGEETLTTKPGEMRTLHLHSAAGVEAIDVWSGLDLRGLPLKIRYTDRQGDVFDQVAEDIEFDGMPVTARNQ